jgi:flagellar M-ring protein FliF
MSNILNSTWGGWSRGVRVAAIGAAVLSLALVIWGLFLAFHEEYRGLFTDLAQGDAAVIVERLKKDKVPYRLSDGGATIMVPAEQVHEIRLSLMTGDVPLNGGVGFEIFDKQGLGATEQSQKVSFQRALQGELVRTISSIDNVKQVRVHLVMPESTLFTRDRREASAAVNVAMHPGMSLSRAQIVGVQRLVAAAVPGLTPGHVVVTDQSGVTLSSADAAGTETGSADTRLQVKAQVEEYVTRKIARLLDSAFGPGQAIVSVDVALNFDSTKTTIQDLLPASADAQGGEGRVVRRRQVTGSASNEPGWTVASENAQPARTPSSSTEVEYEYGRRIDEVIAAPGNLARISIGVIVPGDLAEEKRLRIAELVRMAAGIDDARGDAVSVQTVFEVTGVARDAVDAESTAVEAPSAPATPTIEKVLPAQLPKWLAVAAMVSILLLVFALVVRSRTGLPRTLSPEQRQRMLDEIQRALAEDSAAAGRTRS